MTQQRRVALLIDAENIAASQIAEILKHARNLGRLTIARCYGNSIAQKNWQDAIALYHFLPKLTPPGKGKQNATDFALTIDAVSLLHRDLFDDVLLASSDADFSALTIHIREYGKGIYCFGDAEKLKGNYRNVFDQVFEFESAKAPVIKPVKVDAPLNRKVVPKTEIMADKLEVLFRDYPLGGKPVTIQAFGIHLAKHLPAGYRNGHGTLLNYLKKSAVFDISKEQIVTLRNR